MIYRGPKRFLNLAKLLMLIVDHSVVPSVNDLLPVCDCLICDYSALYHDFLLLDKPLIMVPYDMEKILKERGFCMIILSILLGQ